MLNYVQFRYKANMLINSRDNKSNEVLTVYATLGDYVTFNEVYDMGEKASTHRRNITAPLDKILQNAHPLESKTNLGFLGYHFKQCFSISLAATFSKKYILLYDNLVHIYLKQNFSKNSGQKSLN